MNEEANRPKTPAEVVVTKGVEFVLGFDTDRIWATGAQAFVNGAFTMLVFREQIVAQPDDGGVPEPIARNVASIVLPTEVMKELHELLGPILGNANGQQ